MIVKRNKTDGIGIYACINTWKPYCMVKTVLKISKNDLITIRWYDEHSKLENQTGLLWKLKCVHEFTILFWHTSFMYTYLHIMHMFMVREIV